MKAIAFLTLFCAVCLAQGLPKYRSDASNWEEVSLPKANTPEFQRLMKAANGSPFEWAVSIESGRVNAKLTADVKPAEKPNFSLDCKDVPIQIRDAVRCSQQVENGWLVAYNRGEFGGALWWFSINGATNRQLSPDQVNQFVKTKDGIFAMTGLAHGSTDEGSIIRLTNSRGKWQAATFAKLPQSGRAGTALADGTLVVVTADGLLCVAKDGQVAKLISGQDWGLLYPNSIATNDSKEFYIGMRQFVVVCSPSKPDGAIKWLIPGKQFLSKSD